MNNDFRQIAIYGKGGIGKSTVASNVAVACQEMGRRVIQVGCSPKTDSTTFLLGGEPQELNILDRSRESGIDENSILEVIEKGYKDIYCVEAGGPEPAEGCAGRGVSMALDLLVKYKVYERLETDLVIYDVIGDVVCGGFALPMRAGYARELYLVTSGEMMSLYSSNNICIAISELSKRGAKVKVAGLINNMRQVKNERQLVEEFAQLIKVPVIAHIPRSDTVQQAEARGGTVMQIYPQSEQAAEYRRLAQTIVEGAQMELGVPAPLELEDIMELLRKHQAQD